MKISYNKEADVLSIRFRETGGTAQSLADGVTGEQDQQGQWAGLMIQEASRRVGDLSGLRAVVLEGLGPPVTQGKPPSTVVAPHIVLDERGVAWIDDTNVKVIEVVLDRVAQGLSAEEIYLAYPGSFSLAQIHAALAYYHDHQAAFDAEIERQVREVEALRAAQGKDTPIHKKLREAGRLP